MQTEQQNSLRLLQWMMAASLALPMALFIFAASMSYISTQAAADREIERALDVAHEHALKVFETIDRSISEVNEIIRGQSDADIRAREQTIHLRLKYLADALPQVKSVWIFDTKGEALVNSLMVPAPGLNFYDRDYFGAHVAKDVGLYIGAALAPRLPYLGAVFFGASRRRQSEDGNFTGVIQASVLPEYFENFYARIGRDKGSFFALGLTNGAVLARYPSLDAPARIDPKGSVGQQIALRPRDGLITVISPADGIERRLGYERLADYPVYVAAGLETAAIRSRWLALNGSYLLFGAPLTVMLFLILSLALRRTRRLYVEESKRREAEDALRHGQRLEALGQLTGGVAHDFNNLLTVIRSSVDLLKRPDISAERRHRYIDAISTTVDRAAKLTSQLLAFARRQTLTPKVFEVGQCVRSVSEIIRTLTGSRVEIVINLPDEPCFVEADVSQFETALINMAVNARDAMQGEGRLTLTLRTKRALPDQPANPALAYVAIAVEDTGVGIPRDQFDRIFEPFFTTKEVGRGTGLGLSQVFGFAKQSGGEVIVTSEMGQGSTFTLFLPQVSAADLLPPAPVRDMHAIDGQGIRVLVVEDNADVGQFAADALLDLGYAATLVPSAAEALVELHRDSSRFDIVFSDVVMPGMTGIELAQEIRRRYADMPVVLASGYSHVLAEKGTFGFELLQKPYSVEQLSRAIEKIMQWKKADQRSAE